MYKLYYSITEVAETIGVDESLLRYWEKEFSSFIKPCENDKGIQFYKDEDIEIIKQIYFLVETQGFSLNDAKQKLKQQKEGDCENP